MLGVINTKNFEKKKQNKTKQNKQQKQKQKTKTKQQQKTTTTKPPTKPQDWRPSWIFGLPLVPDFKIGANHDKKSLTDK